MTDENINVYNIVGMKIKGIRTIGVGTTNKTKIGAVISAIRMYEDLAKANIHPIKANSGVRKQPITIAEIIRGAKNRAKNSLGANDIGIGIESGIYRVPSVAYMECTFCVIYDGKDYAYGQSPAFKLPQRMVELVIERGYDLNQAFKEIGMTDDPEIGADQGVIGALTNSRIDRMRYTEQAVIMALIQLEHGELYSA